MIGGVGHRVAQRVGVQETSPAGVEHLDAQSNGVLDGGDGVGRGARAACTQKLERHNAGRPAHAGDTFAVVAGRSEQSRHVRAVTVVVVGIVVAIAKIPAVDIVGVSVAVVVEIIAGDFVRVGVDHAGQVFVIEFNAAVDHSCLLYTSPSPRDS